MAFPGLLRWTVHKSSRICCRSSFPLNGLLLSQQRSFSLGGSSGIRLLGSSSSRGRSGWRLVLLRNSSEKLVNARVYSSTTGDGKKASASAEDNNDPGNLDTDEACTLYLSDEDLDTLTEGNPEMIQKVRHIQLEHEIFLVPSPRVMDFTQRHYSIRGVG
ncbi:unnamed protein product [Allacma fusca]|uniref:Uncharacterized protein n=1 Tax=Allacma fusca TaxID=39272 RepID=A0A8J2KN79_9HEXA|nr:unnamed protein product [Allacma fusca]